MNDSLIRSVPCSLNAPLLNADRRLLAGLINRLHHSQDLAVGSEAITDILGELTAYAFETLSREEQALAAIGVAMSTRHAREHLRFQEYIANHCLQAALGVNATKELLHFLIAWWHDHILGTDLADIRSHGPNLGLSPP